MTTLKFFNKEKSFFNQDEKIYFLQILAEMLQEGFSIYQSLQFMKILLPKRILTIDQILKSLNMGQSFDQVLLNYGYSNRIAAQLFFAQKQGRFNQALFEIVNHLKTMRDYQKKLIKTLIYPCFLMIFLTCLLFAMRHWMLPQILSFINKEILETYLLARYLLILFTLLPQISITFLALILFVYLIIDFYLLKLSIINRFQLLVKLPLLGKLIRKYVSYRLADELSYFYAAGFSMQETLSLLISYPIDPLISELANYLHQQFLSGSELSDSLENIGIFTKTLSLVIYQGELTSQTGQKCKLYAKKIFEEVVEDLNKKLSFVQPILFLVIAIIVMAMYLVLMLPMLTMEI
ncbi:competence type IV pilus assembly protein ComGB [Facklamia sp. 7083-14-GEN3]|uniref:competence type IV pilus assembly protein ComGB n=1 Tax=Facklamia sp. 7083-14-GEN3 TaxID=2973478 RepID=UPI00215D3F95|nr:competence type IV pilus assembly protein ComGB [Facklamia sp. 7083-14-GEN3]MCR8969332.1 competence type IV pilus assembly protein ComGB [Facklamia sp. 7083-14-GEN3]